MKTLFKYLLPFAVIVALYNTAGCFEASSEDSFCNEPIEVFVFSSYTSVANSALNISNQVSFSCNLRIEDTMNRTDNFYRSNFVFIRSGKIINTVIKYFIQKKAFDINSSITAHSHKLIYLGKLII